MATNFNKVQLVVGGISVGDNNAAGSLTGTNEYHSFGGSAILWGLTPSVAEINNANFGVRIQFQGVGYTPDYLTHALDLTGFNFSIPAGATIDGIEVEIKGKETGSYYADIDHARITVYYTGGEAGEMRQIKLAGVFVDKPVMIKLGGTFVDKPKLIKVGGTFQ